jgi:multidrug efflux pump subunit AcrA (membrane-fusion protein)
MRKYILTAPVDGKVVFIVPLQENQFMQAGKTIGFVNPADSRYYAQVTLPQSNFGKIALGQRVQLRIDAYPYQEFGFLEGKLSYISRVPSDSGFLANIELPGGLVTNYRKEVQFRSGLKSQALIITRNSRLLQRFYYTMVKAAHP